MPDHQTIEELAARLERERLEADRLYNAALTAVDHAVARTSSLPAAPDAFDHSRLSELNHVWNTRPERPPIAGWLNRRIARLVESWLYPGLERQAQFNAALVDHLNRNVRAQEETTRAVGELLAALGRELEALARFESLLVQFLQTITAYVDSKDRSLGGSELRERLALTEGRLLALKRTVEQRGADRSHSDAAAPPVDAPFAGAVDSVSYVGFEDRFRGTETEIRRRVEGYLPLFAGASNVVDIGCGRGELLALFAEQGVPAVGVDVNAAMVELCRSRGLTAEEGDAIGFLTKQPDATLGGLIAIQVVEHMTPGYLTRFIETAFHKMRPGAALVLETINPACWMAFFETYVRDPTHQQPIHPDTLSYLVQAGGFQQADIQFRAPVPEEDRLERLPMPEAGLEAVSRALNDHADKLNRRLFSFMDYAVIARR